MISTQTKLTSQGQVSVPASVRRLLGLMPGSALQWQEKDGYVIVQRATQHDTMAAQAALFGDRKPEPKSLTQMKRGISTHIKSRHARG